MLNLRNGTMVHPYSDGSGVIYTDTMNNNISTLGPGYALGGRLDLMPTDDFTLYTRYVHYQTEYGQSHAVYNYDGCNGFAAGVPIQRDETSWDYDIGWLYNLGGLWQQLDELYVGNELSITDF